MVNVLELTIIFIVFCTHNADSAFICNVSGGKYRRLFFNVER